jgi:energy-coupling factor transporter ATP-binding protein EcfA2
MFYYWGYGLHIVSEFELPELVPCEFETADVEIRIGKVPETIHGDGVVHRVRVSISYSEYILRTFRFANYYAANGNLIIIDPVPGADAKGIRLFLLSNLFSAILYQRNLIPLHSSGIIHNNKAVLFCGKSGAGKSTLTTYLQQQGFKIFTDDVCVMRQKNGSFLEAVPSYPVVKLWKDSFAKTGIEMMGEDSRIRPELPKYGRFYHDEFDMEPQLIKGLFILNASTRTKLDIQKETTVGAFKGIQKNVFRPMQMDAMNKRNNCFDAASALVSTAQVFTVERPKNGDSVKELADAVIAILDKIN